jgi:hypothetical protein
MAAADCGLRGIAPGMCFVQRAEGQLIDWARKLFQAVNVVDMQHTPGRYFKRIWRPGIDGFHRAASLLADPPRALNQAGVALALLIERFDEMSQFIEVDRRNLQVFSHRLRELLILCCTEIEASFRSVLMGSEGQTSEPKRLSTADFFRLCDPMHLKEFELELRQHDIEPISPFKTWDESRPTRSLPWYDAYNATKHDREQSLDRATLQHCIEALSAVVALFCAQFGIPLSQDWANEPAYGLNKWFGVELRDPDVSSFYIPKISLPHTQPAELWRIDARDLVDWSPERPFP